MTDTDETTNESSAGPMRILSLFAGIGGLERGLESAGVGHTVAQCEIEPFPREVLARHWPDAERFEDVRELGADSLGKIDLICGGFPCQPWSTAGKQRGREDERHLWPEFARLIREVRPAFVVGENVAALLSGGIGEPLADLSAAGYDVAWDCVPAAAVGAPHRRDRVFILAWRRDVCAPPLDVSQAWAMAVRATRERYGASEGDAWPTPRAEMDSGKHRGQPDALHSAVKTWPGWPSGTWPTPKAYSFGDSHAPGLTTLDCVVRDMYPEKERYSHWPAGPRQPQHAWEPPRTEKGIKNRAKRLRALGNAVVPQAAESVGLALLAIRSGVGTDTTRPVVARLDSGRWVASQGGLFDAPEVSRFPRAGTVRGGVAYELAPCAPLSSLSDGGWWSPTAALGMSDSAAEASPTEGMARRILDRNAGNLLEQIAREFWPTPMARDGKDSGDMTRVNARDGRPADTLPCVVFEAGDVAPLSPAWVEALMGLPVGWTDATTNTTASRATTRAA